MTAATCGSKGWATIVRVISVPPANNEGIIKAHTTQMGNLWEHVSLVTLPVVCFYIFPISCSRVFFVTPKFLQKFFCHHLSLL